MHRYLHKTGESFCIRALDSGGPGLLGITTFPPRSTEEEMALLHKIRVDDGYTKFASSFYTNSSAQSFFRTKEGYMGICPLQVREGDEVVVLLGSRVPHVLRRFGKFHCLIGEW